MMAVNPVKENAAKFSEYLESVGDLPLLDAEKWVRDNWDGDPPERESVYSLVTAWGYRGKNKLWRREGDNLVWGFKQSGESGKREEVETEPALGDPKDQFAAVGISLGIAERYARSTASYVAESYDIWDPAQVWEALKECTDVNIAQRKRWWKTWCSKIQAEVPSELQGEINKTPETPGRPDTRGKKLFFVEDGRLIPTSSDDELGVSFSEAYRMAQLERAQPQPSGEGPLVALLQESGKTERARMELEASRHSGAHPESDMEAKIENLRRESEARIESLRRENDLHLKLQAQQFEHMFSTREAEQRHQLEMINKNLERIVNRPQEDNSDIVGKLNKSFPGLGEIVASAVRNMIAPQTSPSIIKIDGQGDMSLDAYERIEALKDRREMIRVAKDTIPDLLQMGKDWAEAKKRMSVEKQTEDLGQGSLPQGPLPQGPDQSASQSSVPQEGMCVACKLPVYFMGSAFQCPRCQVIQTADGVVAKRVVTPMEGSLPTSQTVDVGQTVDATESEPDSPVGKISRVVYDRRSPDVLARGIHSPDAKRRAQETRRANRALRQSASVVRKEPEPSPQQASDSQDAPPHMPDLPALVPG